ncbi:flagellar protein [bacterium]|nr:flagellar protein [bacterium]
MIEVTKLDGSKLFVNEMNIQWIESLPDTAITFLGGARVIVRDTPEEVSRRCNDLIHSGRTTTNQNAGAVKQGVMTGIESSKL